MGTPNCEYLRLVKGDTMKNHSGPRFYPLTLIFARAEWPTGIVYYPIGPDAVWFNHFAGLHSPGGMPCLTQAHMECLRERGFALEIHDFKEAAKKYGATKPVEPKHIKDEL